MYAECADDFTELAPARRRGFDTFPRAEPLPLPRSMLALPGAAGGVLNTCSADVLYEALSHLKRGFWPYAWDTGLDYQRGMVLGSFGGFPGAAREAINGPASTYIQARRPVEQTMLVYIIWSMMGQGAFAGWLALSACVGLDARISRLFDNALCRRRLVNNTGYSVQHGTTARRARPHFTSASRMPCPWLSLDTLCQRALDTGCWFAVGWTSVTDKAMLTSCSSHSRIPSTWTTTAAPLPGTPGTSPHDSGADAYSHGPCFA